MVRKVVVIEDTDKSMREHGDTEPIEQNVYIKKDTPGVKFEGTETGGIASILRENAGVMEFVDPTTLARQKVLPYDNLEDNTLRSIIDIPILGGAAQSVAADAVGTPEFNHTTFKVPAEALRHAKSAALILDHAWAATAGGTLQLYDRTAGAVVAESSPAFTGGEASEWLEITVDPATITADNELCIRANVTTAGAAGETATLYRAILRIKWGAS